MARGPQGEKRPDDPAAAAVLAVRIATGELDEPETTASVALPHLKDPAAVELGRRGGQRGGKARADKLSQEERISIAKRAAEARWKKAAT